METRQGGCHSFKRIMRIGTDEDQQQQHGGNAMVLMPGEEGGMKGIVQSQLAHGELDQGKLALGELAPRKPAQEVLAQSSLAQEATGVVEECRNEEEEEMEGGHGGDDSSGPIDKGIHAEGGHGSSVQLQPQQETAIPEGTKSLQAGDRLPFQSHTRFTQSQLEDLESLFQETHFPSFQVRIGLGPGEPVSGEAIDCRGCLMHHLVPRTRIPEDFGPALECHFCPGGRCPTACPCPQYIGHPCWP